MNLLSEVIKMAKKIFITAAFVLLSCLVFSEDQKMMTNPIAPKIPTEQRAETPSPATHQLTAPDVEAFLDGLVPLEIERSDIAGTVIAVVKDGKVLFQKG